MELLILLVLIVANIIVDTVCRSAPPKSWAATLLIVILVPDALAILVTLKYALLLHQGKLDGLASLIILPGMVICLEFLWLLYLYYSRFYRAKQPPSKPQ